MLWDYFFNFEYFGRMESQLFLNLHFFAGLILAEYLGFVLQHSYGTWDTGLESLSKVECTIQPA